MNAKNWYLLTMTPFVAWFWFWMDIEVWQAALVGALVHMWAWTVIAPTFLGNARDDFVSSSSPGRGRASQNVLQADTGSNFGSSQGAVSANRYVQSGHQGDEEDELGNAQVFETAPRGMGAPSPLGAINPASGMPMLNEWLDVRGDVFGVNSHDN